MMMDTVRRHSTGTDRFKGIAPWRYVFRQVQETAADFSRSLQRRMPDQRQDGVQRTTHPMLNMRLPAEAVVRVIIRSVLPWLLATVVNSRHVQCA